ncbi:hypothetical protein AJ79_07192 [Helicocarpus griseus UAMH5409]|uniref:Uncharacterized protein n=1 Tax=Helicocarpus griseus UAMH5409 TaxID=1447875 RepID=A0A2B7X5T5_9EURO|nr:hypothetical protein AJ79_07192 [Helicocarpus griseus UAMH5409]
MWAWMLDSMAKEFPFRKLVWLVGDNLYYRLPTLCHPLLLAAGNLPLFENPDSEPPKDYYSKLTLPEDYKSLPPDEKAQADELRRRRLWIR